MNVVTHPVVYPDQDGNPMSDNTKQARWIFVLYGNLEAQFRDRADVFVAADNLWYPVEGSDKIRQAPDVYVVFGRPKRDRGSYKQWEEGGVPIHVVFEVWSPGNKPGDEARKLLFYEEHGAEEYYAYDPDADLLAIYTRGPMGAAFVRRNPKTFVSPRLGIRFDFAGDEMKVIGPDGRPFLTFDELKTLQEQETARADRAEARADQAETRAEQEAARAEQEAARADQAAARADQAAARAAQEAARAEQARDEAADALAQLQAAKDRDQRIRVLSRKLRAGTLNPEESAELHHLTNGD